GGHPRSAADRLLALAGGPPPRARAMAARAGVRAPFRRAESLLHELAGWSIDAETLRRYCHQDAAAARKARGGRRASPRQFAAAPGDRELHIDAGKVSTPEGWRDVNVAAAAVRPRGDTATTAAHQRPRL